MNEPRRDPEGCQGREGGRTPGTVKGLCARGGREIREPEQSSPGRGGWGQQWTFVTG
jgi:hypothetical protein